MLNVRAQKIQTEQVIVAFAKSPQEEDNLRDVDNSIGEHDLPRLGEDLKSLTKKYEAQQERLRAIGIDCEKVERDHDRQEIVDGAYNTLARAYQQRTREEQRYLRLLEDEMRYADRPWFMKDLERDKVRCQDQIASSKAEYEEACGTLDAHGIVVPPAEAFFNTGAPESEGIFDQEEYSIGEKGRKMKSLHGLKDIPKEPQFTRWQYQLGPYSDDAEHSGEEEPWGVEIGERDDSLSVRVPGSAEKTNQVKLEEWRKITEESRKTLPKEASESIGKGDCDEVK